MTLDLDKFSIYYLVKKKLQCNEKSIMHIHRAVCFDFIVIS